VYSKLNGALRFLGCVDKGAIKRKASEMRSAKNFHPEREYVAAKSFLVAMAIGAIAFGEVIFSLVDVWIGPASVAALALAANLRVQPIVESTMDAKADNRSDAAANESNTNPKLEPAGIANTDRGGAQRWVVKSRDPALGGRGKQNVQESPGCASRGAESCATRLWRFGLGRERVSLVLTSSIGFDAHRRENLTINRRHTVRLRP
jgi:hypothetical protein